MSKVIMCRSGDCDQEASFYMSRHAYPELRNLLWEGSFCHLHTLRCLDIKVNEISGGDYLMIERITYTDKLGKPRPTVSGGDPV